MPKLKIMFGDVNSEVEIEEIIYKSKKAKLSLRDGEYSEEVLKWNPHLVGKVCTYIVINLKKMNEKEFHELSSHLRVFTRRQTGFDSLIVNNEDKEVLIKVLSTYHSVFMELARLKVIKYYYKSYSINTEIPNNGSPMYVNPPLHKIPYNVYQLAKLFIKRKILCRQHKFVEQGEFRSYCSNCGAKKYPDKEKIDWYFE